MIGNSLQSSPDSSIRDPFILDFSGEKRWWQMMKVMAMRGSMNSLITIWGEKIGKFILWNIQDECAIRRWSDFTFWWGNSDFRITFCAVVVERSNECKVETGSIHIKTRKEEGNVRNYYKWYASSFLFVGFMKDNPEIRSVKVAHATAT